MHEQKSHEGMEHTTLLHQFAMEREVWLTPVSLVVVVSFIPASYSPSAPSPRPNGNHAKPFSERPITLATQNTDTSNQVLRHFSCCRARLLLFGWCWRPWPMCGRSMYCTVTCRFSLEESKDVTRSNESSEKENTQTTGYQMPINRGYSI